MTPGDARVARMREALAGMLVRPFTYRVTLPLWRAGLGAGLAACAGRVNDGPLYWMFLFLACGVLVWGAAPREDGRTTT